MATTAYCKCKNNDRRFSFDRPHRTGDASIMPSQAFMPDNADASAPVGAVLPGIKNQFTLKEVANIHMIQQANLQKNIDNQALKAKADGRARKERQMQTKTRSSDTLELI